MNLKMKALLCFLLLACCTWDVLSFKHIKRASFTCTSFKRRFATVTAVSNGRLKPFSNNVLVKVKEIPSKSAGGIYIPDSAKERATEGLVVAVGPGKIHSETGNKLKMSVCSGDSVVYGKYDGIELKYNDVNHQVVKDDDILLKYSGSEKTIDNVQVVRDLVLVRLSPKTPSNASGLIVSVLGGAEKQSDDGVVVKVGPGRQTSDGKLIPMDIQEGDCVRFREFGGNKVRIGEEELLVIRAQDILARWEQ